VGERENFLVRHPWNENVDLVIRLEGGSEQVTAEISFAAENP
jgi:type 1 glutamine amidotransferase